MKIISLFFQCQTSSPHRLSSSTTLILLSIIAVSLVKCSSAHYEAKPSGDPDENLGKAIDLYVRNVSHSDAANQEDASNSDLAKKSEDPSAAGVLNSSLSSQPHESTSNHSNYEEEEEDYETDDNNNYGRRTSSRIAAVVIYGSVILIALFGVIVRYFMTQYEVLQAKAQLEYQQLRNIQSCP